MEDKPRIMSDNEYYKMINLYSDLALSNMDCNQIGYMGNIQAFIFCTKYNVKLDDYIETLKKTTEDMLKRYYEDQEEVNKIINNVNKKEKE